MNNISKNFFLTILLIFCLSPRVYAAQKAQVIVPKAIIYSDRTLTTAIGYVSAGRELTVGENPQSFGTIVPVIVSGRIAYVQVKDIEFKSQMDEKGQSRKIVREHEVSDSLDKNPLLSLKDNNYLVLSYNVLPLSGDWDELADISGNSSGGEASGIAVHVEHRPPDIKYSFGVGFGYYTAASDELKMRIMNFEGNFYYSPIKFGFVSIELLGGLGFSGDTRIKTASDLPEARGTMFSTQYGVQARILPKFRFGAVAGISVRNMKFLNLDEIEAYEYPGNPNIISTTGRSLKSVSSTTTYIGISYKF